MKKIEYSKEESEADLKAAIAHYREAYETYKAAGDETGMATALRMAQGAHSKLMRLEKDTK